MKVTFELDENELKKWQNSKPPRKPAPHKYGAQGDTPADEKAEREAVGRTQGRKGCKQPRINMAFTTPNYKYLKQMAKLNGMTLTEFCNAVIEQHRQEHSGPFDNALEVFLEGVLPKQLDKLMEHET